MYYYHENESNSDPPMEIYEDVFVNDYDASGFYFVRGPNIYATEVGGTTYFIQDAIPVPLLGLSYNYSNDLSSFSAHNGEISYSINENEGSYYEHSSQEFAVERYEDVRANDIDVSSLPNITTGYTFIRGPNVYASEVAGTTYFVQDAIPFPVNIAGSIEPSYSEDLSHTSPPISSDVFDVENIDSLNNVDCYPESNEKDQTSNGHTSYVKCKEECHSEKNTKIKRKVKKIKVKGKKSVEYKSSVKTEEICNLEAVKKLDGHESYGECHEFRYLEVKEKLISISEPLQPSYSEGVSHTSSQISSDVLDVENTASSNSVICYTEYEEKVEISNGQTCSSKCKEVWHTVENKRSKRKVKTIKAKAKEVVDHKSTVKTEEIWNFELSKKVKKLDKYKRSFASDESCNLEVNENIACTPEICTAQEKKSKENKNDVIYGQVSNLYANEKDEKTDYSKNSVKGNNQCNLEENKTNKRRVKKRKAKERKLKENENAVKSKQSWNSESIKKVQQKDDNKMAVKSNELCNLEGNVKNENSLKDKFCVKNRKRKGKGKKILEHQCSVTNEASSAELKENLTKSDIHNVCLKSDEVCAFEVKEEIKNVKEFKMSIKSKETSNLEANKSSKKKRKNRKRKGKGKKVLEHQCSVTNEASSAELKENLTKSDIHNVCLKSDEVCAFEVKEEIKNVKEFKLCSKTPDVSDLEQNKKRRKVKKKKRKDEISVENKSVCFHEDTNLESNDHVASNDRNIFSTTITDQHSTINDECSIAEKIDSNKTFDSSRETQTVSTYVSECDVTKNVEEERETNTCKRPSSVKILHSNGNDLFDMSDQKSLCVNEKDKLEHVDGYPVSTSKIDGGPNKQSNVQFQECNSPSDVHVTRSDLSYKESPSSSPTSKAVKKRRFQRIRKWFNGLFSCVRKNKD